MPKHSGVYVEKTLTFICPNTDLCLEILQKIEEELSLEADIYAELKFNKLVFTVIGLEPNVQSAIIKLREFLALYALRKADPKHGIDSNTITKYLKRTIPLDVLAIVIRENLGIPAEVRGSIIYADTDLDSFLSVAKKVAEAHKKVEQIPLPSNLKKLLIAAMATYNLDHREIMDILRNAQLINEYNELKKPWPQILEELENLLDQGTT